MLSTQLDVLALLPVGLPADWGVNQLVCQATPAYPPQKPVNQLLGLEPAVCMSRALYVPL